MNALPEQPAADSAATVDASNPWLGLASFTEETRAYFYGREDEVAELGRRVQRKLLTLLFGQSGLGKTSILRAGLVPRLRGQGYCPVYVRIDYGHDAPEPAVQIKQAIFQASRVASWTQAGVAVEGESLWEFLHHRDDVLKDESGRTLIPLLIFDQFEEIFTLAQSDDFGRARAARFIADLADLVENRPPKDVEAKLEEDDTAAERFDFARSDYRVLITLREDYLAPLEGLKSAMPSITQNRLRLAPMTGTQALEAVLRPGGRLVNREVAEAIVRFVAGDAEIANAEVEPSLLSLICRELNDKRVAEGRAEISLDLLAGSHATILSEFYERSLADQPAAVRRVIEDELLTESGYRENVAEERLAANFAAAGAAPGTLATLVNRRLLRIEERLDVRRVELTHDVLCGVVKSSRDLRQEREARDKTEQLLAEQQERELTAKRSLVRARQVASVCLALALGALLAAAFAYFATQRARRAEQAALASRNEAEHVLGYLTDDLATELEANGRLEVVRDLTQREVDYYRGLPKDLETPETARNGARTLAQYGLVLGQQGDMKQARAALDESIGVLDGLRAKGDRSAATAEALCFALTALAGTQNLDNDFEASIASAKRAADVLTPFANAPDASETTRRTFARAMLRYGRYLDTRNRDQAAAIKMLSAGRDALRIDPKAEVADLPSAVAYGQVAWALGDALYRNGRPDEALTVLNDGAEVTQRVLAARPGHLGALRSQSLLYSSAAAVNADQLRLAKALPFDDAARVAGLELRRLNPTAMITNTNLVVDSCGRAQNILAPGPHPRSALAEFTRGRAMIPEPKNAVEVDTIMGICDANQLGLEADLGDLSAARATHARMVAMLSGYDKAHPEDTKHAMQTALYDAFSTAYIDFRAGDSAGTRTALERYFSSLEKMPVDSTGSRRERAQYSSIGYDLEGDLRFAQGDYSGAVTSYRTADESRRKIGDKHLTAHQRDVALGDTKLAMALAYAGRFGDARQIIEPVVAQQRTLYAQNEDEQAQRVEFAAALYVQALVDPASRAALLKEARGVLATVSPEYRSIYTYALWARRIEAGGRGLPAATG